MTSDGPGATAAAPAVTHPEDAPDPRHLAAAVRVLRGRLIAALTGAGISTDSGLPDYRGPGSPQRRPMTYQEFISDPARRRHYWARNHIGWQHMRRTEPNAGHTALARMEAAGVVTGVITQNIDTLHELAGSRNVIDLHGRYDRVVCLDCGAVTSRARLAERLTALNPGFAPETVEDIEIAPDADAVIRSTEHFRVADCERCGGPLKPDIVFFGETVPPRRAARAAALVDSSEALLVVGSSLAVHSGRRFVQRAVDQAKPVVIVNRGPTRGDQHATVTIEAGTSPTLTRLADALAPVRPQAARSP